MQRSRQHWVIVAVVSFTMFAFTACSGPQGDRGPAGPDGINGLPGGDGAAGAAGATGSIGPTGATGSTGTVGDAGATGATGTAGTNGLNAGQTPGLSLTVALSAPANGTHYVAGEAPVVTVTLKDERGYALTTSDLGTGRLTIAGPMDATKTKTAVALMRASADYASSQHHYVNLLATPDANLQVSGNVITYKLNAVANEAAGTYLVGVWTVAKKYPADQAFANKEIQIGTAVAQAQIVGNCVDCHKGPISGMTYLHHIDPGYSPTGNYALDADPVRTCKACHNEAGYAAYCGVQGQSPCLSATRSPTRLSSASTASTAERAC
ncbi:MAG: hypothetical protein ACYC8T_01155 [Myxococcaceae bacterium]